MTYAIQEHKNGVWVYIPLSLAERPSLAKAKWEADKLAREGKTVRVVSRDSGRVAYTPTVSEWEKQARYELRKVQYQLTNTTAQRDKEVEARYKLVGLLRSAGIADLDKLLGQCWEEYRDYNSEAE
jgi:short-subunit dehydrogenase